MLWALLAVCLVLGWQVRRAVLVVTRRKRRRRLLSELERVQSKARRGWTTK